MTAKQLTGSIAPDTSQYVTLTDGAGNLAALTVSDNITVGTSVISGGTNKGVLFNNGGVVGADAGFTYQGASGVTSIVGPLNIGSAVTSAAPLTVKGGSVFGWVSGSTPLNALTMSVWGAADTGPSSSVKGVFQIGATNSNGLSFGNYSAVPFANWIQAFNAQIGAAATFPIALNPIGGGVVIGGTDPGSATLKVAGGIASTSITTGDIVTTGGVGIGGAICGGKTLNITNTADAATIAVIAGLTKAVRIGTDTATSYVQGVDNTGSGSYQALSIGGSSLEFQISGTPKASLAATGVFSLLSNVTSSSTTTGTLVVTGGVGISGALYLPGAAAAVLNTTTTITTGAGASVGTLTNAPAAGNPTKWIPFNDAGTTRYFPAW